MTVRNLDARLMALVLMSALAISALQPTSGAQAAPLDNTAAGIKAAAVDRVNRLSPGVPVESAEISRVVGDYAIVIVYPPSGVTDPAMVVLQYASGAWTAIAGPGTAFPPGSDRGGAPDTLFDYVNPYVGRAGAANLARIAGRGQMTFRGDQFSFDFASTATAGPLEGSDNGTIDLVGPYLAGPPFHGPGYEIISRNFGPVSDQPLDEFGYDLLQRQLAAKEAEGGPPSSYQPIGVTFFHAGANDVFQVDYPGGDAIIREFYLERSGGGSIVGITTRVYPVQRNPAALLADSAVTLLLQTLRVAGE